ncbi:unnamed protein product [Protopolystoma xenopodis]|uniref:Septin-type G domain-containing protein n=1 Tax=Protopolystoma xenopodis TaxID=117903 RepID=A0A448WFH1_9PLAT|nr:unnamed protein product [Protopolystoma xenopodis]
MVETENLEHNDFSALKTLLLNTHMQDLIEVTHVLHYSNYRANRLTGIAEAGRFTSRDGRDPLAQLEADRIEHQSKLAKLEQEMEAVFEQKATTIKIKISRLHFFIDFIYTEFILFFFFLESVRERATKLAETERNLKEHAGQMQADLAQRMVELDIQRRQFEEERSAWEVANKESFEHLYLVPPIVAGFRRALHLFESSLQNPPRPAWPLRKTSDLPSINSDRPSTGTLSTLSRPPSPLASGRHQFTLNKKQNFSDSSCSIVTTSALNDGILQILPPYENSENYSTLVKSFHDSLRRSPLNKRAETPTTSDASIEPFLSINCPADGDCKSEFPLDHSKFISSEETAPCRPLSGPSKWPFAKKTEPQLCEPLNPSYYKRYDLPIIGTDNDIRAGGLPVSLARRRQRHLRRSRTMMLRPRFNLTHGRQTNPELIRKQTRIRRPIDSCRRQRKSRSCLNLTANSFNGCGVRSVRSTASDTDSDSANGKKSLFCSVPLEKRASVVFPSAPSSPLPPSPTQPSFAPLSSLEASNLNFYSSLCRQDMVPQSSFSGITVNQRTITGQSFVRSFPSRLSAWLRAPTYQLTDMPANYLCDAKSSTGYRFKTALHRKDDTRLQDIGKPTPSSNEPYDSSFRQVDMKPVNRPEWRGSAYTLDPSRLEPLPGFAYHGVPFSLLDPIVLRRDQVNCSTCLNSVSIPLTSNLHHSHL